MRRCRSLHGVVSLARLDGAAANTAVAGVGLWSARWIFFPCLCLGVLAGAAEPTPTLIKVRADKVVSRITPYMTGACIEDVNHEIYGGIYSQMVFGESFEEPGLDKSVEAMGFDRFGGGWTLGPEGLEASSGPGYKLVLRDREVGDGEISVSLFFPDRTGYAAGLIARVREAGVGPDAFVGYELAVGPSANFARIGRHRKNWEPMKDMPFPVPVGSWIELKAILKGPSIEILVDGKSAVTFNDAEHALAPGAVGLRTWNSKVLFRDLKIRSGSKEETIPLRRTELMGPPEEVSSAWDAVREGSARAEFRVEGEALNGRQCQKVTFISGEGAAGVENRGLNRWGLFLAAGKPYEGYVHLKCKEPAEVFFSFRDEKGRALCEERAQVRPGGWRPYTLALTPAATASRGSFAVLLRKPGTVCVDQAYVQPGPWGRFRNLPVRRDIAEALVAQGLTVLRLGGWMINAQEYRWKKMIGPRELRPPYAGNWYPHSSNGWGILDFMDFCEKAGFLPVVAVNIEEEPGDMADFVEYANGAANTRWGRARALDGHPEPYGLRHVQIGNEETLNDHYVERFRILSDVMGKADPGLTFYIAAWFDEKNPAARKLIELSRGKKVLWDVHVGGDGIRDADRDGKAIERMRTLFKEWCAEADVKVAILEENGGLHDVQRALGHAHMVNTMERMGDFVLIQCPANCLQPLGQNDNGWDQGQLFFTPGQVWGMPPYHVQRMIAACRQPICVEADAGGPGGPLDVTATRSEDSRTLVLKVVNLEATPVRAKIEIAGFEVRSPTARASELSGDLKARNTPEEPERIAERDRMFPWDGSYVFPPHSFTVLMLR